MEEKDIYLGKIDQILKKHLTEKAFDLWTALKEHIPNKCWDKPTSSTGKYHRKEDGRVPSVSEHTFEIVYTIDKIIPMFEGSMNKDVVFLAAALHDSYKYGLVKTCTSTEKQHDRIIADFIKKNKDTFLKVLSEGDVNLLEEGVRRHMGKWGTEVSGGFSYSNYSPLVTFLSTLDMLSSKNILKIL